MAGDEQFDFGSLDALSVGQNPLSARIVGARGEQTVALRLPIHTSTELDYLRHGGLLPFVVRQSATGPV